MKTVVKIQLFLFWVCITLSTKYFYSSKINGGGVKAIWRIFK